MEGDPLRDAGKGLRTPDASSGTNDNLYTTTGDQTARGTFILI